MRLRCDIPDTIYAAGKSFFFCRTATQIEISHHLSGNSKKTEIEKTLLFVGSVVVTEVVYRNVHVFGIILSVRFAFAVYAPWRGKQYLNMQVDYVQ